MEKKALLLLSDGLDSPVAAYLMIKKGFFPIYITFLTTKAHRDQMEKKTYSIAQKLSIFSEKPVKHYFIPHSTNLHQIILKCPRKLTCILCKRLMFRIVEEIGKKEGINLIITGDILGEQASQTLSNLYSYNDLFHRFIKITPLIGLNKLEIINKNKEIGLYDICSKKIDSCQNYPQYPETNAKIREIINAEKRLNLKDMISKSLENMKCLTISNK
jgi:thiamine biosynthesis protein ThiI